MFSSEPIKIQNTHLAMNVFSQIEQIFFLKTEILETGLSDFHKRIVTSATIEFEKQPWQMFTY